ncbi:hypothetical protein [Streptomyces gardneri]|uniref:Uncharacterized protein n=1 Tax=Streptomyces gardneri TaxID=66892 RepID=A0A4Y3RY63_9ACTN|nr:hypothetical protein [Streptomyces gardneri]GEB61703.1 hypothetical protein SGA01_73080 [Streptomyces gardneri]GHH22750.1 hypothetical protein GCM10017674_78780 [Streptomyces gardneri]
MSFSSEATGNPDPDRSLWWRGVDDRESVGRLSAADCLELIFARIPVGEGSRTWSSAAARTAEV